MLSDLVRSYSKEIEEYARKTGVLEIKVSPTIEHRNTTEFENSLIFAETGVSEDLVAILISSENAFYCSMPIKTLMIPRTFDGSILVDSNNELVATDFFYVCENSMIKPVQLSEPLHLDGLNMSIDDETRGYNISNHILLNGPVLTKLVGSKLETKKLFRANGLNTPNYYVIEPDFIEKTISTIEEFLKTHKITDFVIKADDGSRGNEVLMFKNGETTDSIYHLLELFWNKHPPYLDERIFPLEWGNNNGKRIDWNVRAFLGLLEEPVWIDAIVRYDLLTEKPINISQGAKFEELEVVADITKASIPEIVNEGLKAAKIIYQKVKESGEEPRGYLGLDMIVSEKGIYHIEANDSGSGGFYELIILRKNKLSSVSERLLPAFGPFLLKNHKRNKKSLSYTRQYKADGSTYFDLGSYYHDKGLEEQEIDAYKTAIEKSVDDGSLGTITLNLGITEGYDKSIEIIKKVVNRYPNFELGFLILLALLDLAKKPEEVVKLILNLTRLNSQDTGAYMAIARNFRHLKHNQEAAEVYKRVVSMDPNNKEAKAEYEELVANMR